MYRYIRHYCDERRRGPGGRMQTEVKKVVRTRRLHRQSHDDAVTEPRATSVYRHNPVGATRVAGLSMKCKDASRLVSEARDRQLGIRERSSLRMHLWMCGNCRRFMRQIRLLGRALGRLADPDDTAGRAPVLSAGERAHIRRELAGHGGSSC